MARWPYALPQVMLRDGWGITPVSPHRRTEMDDGAVAVTRRFARIRTLLPARWQMSGGQFLVFQDFWRADLDAGRLWFDCPVFRGVATEVLRVRFSSDPPWQVAFPAHDIYQVSAELEIADLPAMSPTDRDAWETALILDDPAAVASTIDAAVARIDDVKGAP